MSLNDFFGLNLLRYVILKDKDFETEFPRRDSDPELECF